MRRRLPPLRRLRAHGDAPLLTAASAQRPPGTQWPAPSVTASVGSATAGPSRGVPIEPSAECPNGTIQGRIRRYSIDSRASAGDYCLAGDGQQRRHRQQPDGQRSDRSGLLRDHRQRGHRSPDRILTRLFVIARLPRRLRRVRAQTAGTATSPANFGYIVVADVHPVPTSKDQCKNGGWRNYGSQFKNQGSLRSFVATGGKRGWRRSHRPHQTAELRAPGLDRKGCPMRRRFGCTAVGVVAAVVLAVAPPAPRRRPDGDRSRPGDLQAPTLRAGSLWVDAQWPGGENPRNGWAARRRRIGAELERQRHLFSVSDNRAVVGFSGTLSFFGPVPRPIAGLVRVVDGGGPASAQDTIEWAEVQGQLGGEPIPGPTDCSSYPSTFSPGVIHVNQQGDIVVTDAQPPLPTAKDQCKNNGWRNYGDRFKNQGACLSFVATGGKQKS